MEPNPRRNNNPSEGTSTAPHATTLKPAPHHTRPPSRGPQRHSRPGEKGGRHFGRSSHPPRRGKARVEHQQSTQRKQSIAPIPPPAADTVRIIPLGGVEEIGRNMTAIEFGNDIFILDCGFAFSEEDTPGIDYILPNTGYLEERRDKIRGILISHGHLDHIGGIPFFFYVMGNT